MPEEQVLLEAVAAAPAVNQLVHQRGCIQPDWKTAKKRVEVLEGDRLGMQPMQGS